MSFSAADKQHLEAAEGWLGLGSHIEAEAELDLISPRFRAHPDVLRVRFDIYAKAEKWEAAADIARAISKRVPDSHFGFVYMAHALHKLGQIREAWNVLVPIVGKFPHQFVIRYDLACYACRLGNLKEAWRWLKMAIDLADTKEVKRAALSDPDLQPLWLEIGQI